MDTAAFSAALPLGLRSTSPRGKQASVSGRRAAPVARIGSRALGVDYGLRRVGLAVSVGVAPRPLPRIEHQRDPARAAAAVARAAAGTVSETIVVGLPLDAHGREGEQVAATRAFLHELVLAAPWANILSLDERFSTVEAKESLKEAGVSKQDLHMLVDSASAVVLLNRFFGDRDNGEAVTIHKAVETEWKTQEKPAEEPISFAEWKRKAMARAKANTVLKKGRKR